ncbi:helix-hairpin-helix domain-containing protein [Evansella sp. AB-P1]|uniref:helix-hairpin-helix domain-containing protein n=1 Tax=Evansella sp. AB-P1 TaxID=3037653 RepID=UPI00241F8EA5|nr:helix-hairpin-helix domain-containing protein [Evansella sp. AB-P1]MDG5786519.1 helix-hairpin-helix domain-containing protein [Evansella sp. AB-P1]
MQLLNLNRKIVIIVLCLCFFIVGSVVSMFLQSMWSSSSDEEWEIPWMMNENEEDLNNDNENNIVQTIYVDIKGEVKFPGIYQLNLGDRVFNAIEMAGGFSDNAQKNAINLAEKCYDEMVIYVPSFDSDNGEGLSYTHSQGDSKIRINQASLSELTELPGVGPAKGEAIIRYREENGPFSTVDELTQVPGIGEKMLENIRDYIRIP